MTDVTKIKVGQHKVGIIGIKQVLSEMANECGGISDEELQMELLNRLSKKNYISENVKNDLRLL